MRMLLKITIDTEAGNRALQDGTLQQVIESTMGRFKPEAAYFTTVDGHRGGYIFFDLQDASQLPVLSEPLFQRLHAKVELQPVMTPEDLQRGLQQLS
jgi:hypothetical protein